jgi:hypothetical protein
MQEETSRLRDQFQQAGDRFEERLEGWLEEPEPPRERWDPDDDSDLPDPRDLRETRRRPQDPDDDPWI